MTAVPVAEAHRFDEGALAAWMAANVEGYQGPLQVREFLGGQSNPTYQLATPSRAYVMRRKPPGRLLRSAHAVDREFRVISALHPTGFPVPRPYGLCADEAVIGTMFYVMEMVEGRILWDPSLPDSAPDERRAIHTATLRTLTDLHNTDWRAVGLEGFGAPGNYMLRQIDRWTKQYRASETTRVETMERLLDWLPRTAPQDDRTTIVHGDYKLGNIVTHPTKPRVAAVLDWELATLGNPVADFAYLMMPWVDGAIAAVPDLAAHGIPTVEACAEEYCRLTGRPEGLPHLDWFFAFNFFRLAGILQGIVGRVRDGTANAPDAATMEARVPVLAATAWTFAVKMGA
jgi:aminoglycoside phosphotransferase (APT) family kinase protein